MMETEECFAQKPRQKEGQGSARPGAPPLQGQIGVNSLYPGGLSVCLLCFHKWSLGQNSFHTTHKGMNV